jgi:hypothetical protein
MLAYAPDPLRSRLLPAAGAIVLVAATVGAAGQIAGPASLPTLRPPLCFAPGTSQEVVDSYHQHDHAGSPATSTHLTPEGYQFPDGNRWSQTASSPGPLSQGQPTTIRWSIVPDGTSIYGYIGEPTSPSNLRAWLNGIYGSEAVWLPIFQGVFARWGQLIGVTYVYEPADDGAPWTASTIDPGVVGVRGDVRIAGHFIDGNGNVLAYNFYPDLGDMVLDTADNTYNNLSSNSIRLRNVLAHEHGHGLGIQHVCPANGTKLMEPFLNVGFDGPQQDDILAGNRGYGDPMEDNDVAAQARDLGALTPSVTSMLLQRSVDDNSDLDFFRFTVGAGSSLTATITPTGSTYLSGPQNPNGSCSAGTLFDALRQNDVGIEIRDMDGVTVLATANASPAGVAETLSNVFLPSGAGTYYVRTFPGAANAAQMYDLALTSSSGGPPPPVTEWRMNSGGPNYTDVDSDLFEADRAFVAGSFGFTGGGTGTFGNPVAGTTDDALYQDMRGGASFSYTFDALANGTYDLTLFFMEPWATAVGQRTFDVTVEGVLRLDNHDIFQRAPGQFRALVETLPVTLTDGQLNVAFQAVTGNNAVVSALALVTATPPPPEPDIAVNPTSLAFGSVVAGNSADLSVTVSNVGTATLDVTGLVTTNPAFSVISPAAPFSVAPSGSQAVVVRFAPPATGPFSGNLEIASTDPDEALTTVPLSGTGIPTPTPDIDVSPASVAFGSVTVGASADRTVTVSNAGTAMLTVSGLVTTDAAFAVVSPPTPFSVAPSGSQAVVVRFTPPAAGPFAGDLQVTSNDPDEGVTTVPLSGTGVTPSPVTAYRMNSGGPDYTDVNGALFEADRAFVPGNFGFIGGGVGNFPSPVANTTDDPLYQDMRGGASFAYAFSGLSSGDWDVTLHFMEPWATNVGQRTFDVTIEGVLRLDNYDIFQRAGGTFRAMTETLRVAVTDGQLDVAFQVVTGNNAVVSALAVVSVAPPPPAPDISVSPTSVAYGNVVVGGTSDRTVTVSNVGSATLNVTGLATTNAAFSVVSPATPFAVAPGGSQAVVVRFAPPATGPFSGNLQITSDDPDEGLTTVPLAGTGVPPATPDIDVSPTSVAFGSVTVGNTADRTVTVSNVGTATLNVSNLTTTSATFSVVSPATPFAVPVSGSQAVVVRFAPPSAGPFSGNLEITSDDPDEGLTIVPLTGTGTNPPPPVAQRMNSGGPSYTDVNGALFEADRAFVPGNFGFVGGGTGNFPSPVANTTDDPLYQDMRGGAPFAYTFDALAAGDYDVTFHFMEPWATSVGQRTFDVTIEGVLRLDNYDIFQRAGGQFIALTETLRVTLTDGQLNIGLAPVTGSYAIVSALAVLSAPGSQTMPSTSATSRLGDVFPAGVGDGVVSLADLVTAQRAATTEGPVSAFDLARLDLAPGLEVAAAGGDAWCPIGDASLGVADLAVLGRIVDGTARPDCGAAPAARGSPWVAADVAPPGGGDGRVDVADVVTLLRLATGVDAPSPDASLLADVAPARREGSRVVVAGDGRLDVADVVLALRVAVGLDEVSWPRRTLVVRLAATADHAALSVTLRGWPTWARVEAFAAPTCATAGLDVADGVIGLACLAGEAPLATGDVLSVSYTAPRAIGPSELSLRLELVDADLATLPAAASVAVP